MLHTVFSRWLVKTYSEEPSLKDYICIYIKCETFKNQNVPNLHRRVNIFASIPISTLFPCGYLKTSSGQKYFRMVKEHSMLLMLFS